MNVYIIKKIISNSDEYNGLVLNESYLNWVFGSKEKAETKCKELNENLGHRSSFCQIKFEVEKQVVE